MGRGLKKKVAPYLNFIAACGWQALRFPGGPVLDYRFIVGVLLSLDAIEARYALRSFHAFRESSSEVPSLALYEAEYDDPELARYHHERDRQLHELNRSYAAHAKEMI